MGFLLLDSPLGALGILGEEAVERLILPGQPMPRLAIQPTPVLSQAAEQLSAYFQGDLPAFDLPLAPQGTAFQMAVWDALQEIPYGEVRTYGEVARAIGRPKTYRAVGQANNRNPLPILIPCHRVVGTAGLTGYAGGLEAKSWLLDLEKSHR